MPGLIKLEPPRQILNLLSCVHHQFDPLPGGRDESLRKFVSHRRNPISKYAAYSWPPSFVYANRTPYQLLEKKGSRKDPRLLTGMLYLLQGFLYRLVKTEVKEEKGGHGIFDNKFLPLRFFFNEPGNLIIFAFKNPYRPTRRISNLSIRSRDIS